jgi:hypothetical protein
VEDSSAREMAKQILSVSPSLGAYILSTVAATVLDHFFLWYYLPDSSLILSSFYALASSPMILFQFGRLGLLLFWTKVKLIVI